MEENKRTFVEKMIQGDESAFDELYRSYFPRLYRMAFFITGSKSDSEDVLQETFVKCFLHGKELKNPECFEAWLYRILVRTARRTGKRKTDLSLDGMLEKPESAGIAERLLKDNLAEPLERVVEKEQTSGLWEAIDRLDMKYRIVVLLHYYNELGISEIARITGTLEGTVKSRLFKARKLLRLQLESREAGQNERESIESGSVQKERKEGVI